MVHTDHSVAKSVQECFLLILAVAIVFTVRWSPYLVDGTFVFTDWGSSLLWTDWSAFSFLAQWGAIEWNPLFAFGSNNIASDPFSNPLALNHLIGQHLGGLDGWLSQLFVFECFLALGVFVYLRRSGLSFVCSLFPALLILIYPKSIDEINHGPGKFTGWFAVVPWLFLLIDEMCHTSFRVRSFFLLGIVCAVGFLSGGALVGVMCAYLFVPYFLYRSIEFISASELKWSDGLRVYVLGPLVSLAAFAALSAYLLFPLIDELLHVERSLFSTFSGYTWLDLLGAVFPWQTGFSIDGILNYTYNIPFLGMFNNYGFYFGLITILAVVFVLLNRVKLGKYSFFAIYPILLFLGYSRMLNSIVPLMKGVDKFIGASSAESFMAFNMFFCLAICLGVMVDSLMKGESDVKWKGRKELGSIAAGLLSFYAILIVGYGLLITVAYVFPAFPAAVLNYISDNISSITDYRHTSLLLLLYVYTSTWLSLLLLGSFVARLLQMYWAGRLLQGKCLRGYPVFLFLAVDFFMIVFITCPFTDSMANRYNPANEQNAFVDSEIDTIDRVGAVHFQHHVSSYNEQVVSRIKKIIGEGVPQGAHSAYNLVAKALVDHKGSYLPTMGLGATSYPVVVGKQMFNYHISFLPRYFYRYSAAMNWDNSKYVRQSWNGLWVPSSPLIDMAGIKYVFWNEPVEDSKYVLRKKTSVPSMYIYENTNAVSKAYLVHRVREAASDSQALSIMLSSDFQAGEEAVLLQSELEPSFLLPPTNGIGQPESSVVLEEYKANRIEVVSESTDAGLLIIPDLYHRYWTAFLDGAEVPILRTNVAFRGIEVPSGRHRIILTFRNEAHHIGRVVSGVSVVISAFLLIHMYWKYRRRVA